MVAAAVRGSCSVRPSCTLELCDASSIPSKLYGNELPLSEDPARLAVYGTIDFALTDRSTLRPLDYRPGGPMITMDQARDAIGAYHRCDDKYSSRKYLYSTFFRLIILFPIWKISDYSAGC